MTRRKASVGEALAQLNTDLGSSNLAGRGGQIVRRARIDVVLDRRIDEASRYKELRALAKGPAPKFVKTAAAKAGQYGATIDKVLRDEADV